MNIQVSFIFSPKRANRSEKLKAAQKLCLYDSPSRSTFLSTCNVISIFILVSGVEFLRRVYGFSIERRFFGITQWSRPRPAGARWR